jgi:diacylglycerol kinase
MFLMKGEIYQCQVQKQVQQELPLLTVLVTVRTFMSVSVVRAVKMVTLAGLPLIVN